MCKVMYRSAVDVDFSNEAKALYQIIPEKKVITDGFVKSAHVYDVGEKRKEESDEEMELSKRPKEELKKRKKDKKDFKF